MNFNAYLAYIYRLSLNLRCKNLNISHKIKFFSGKLIKVSKFLVLKLFNITLNQKKKKKSFFTL